MELLEDRRVLSASGTLFEVAPTASGAEVAGAVPGELLVHFRDGATNEDIRGIYQAHGLTELERLYNASDVAGTRRLSVPEAARDSVARALQQHPLVYYAEPNFLAASFFTPNDSYYGYQWNFSNPTYGGINIEQAWDSSTGTGAVVAVLDTGVAYEDYQDATGTYRVAPDLASTRFVAGYDFINNDAHANDDHSHGTHVAGTIAQSTNNSRGTAGVAFDASVMPIKVLGRDGSGSYGAIASGIRWAADQGAQIINMSLGGSSGSQTLKDALAYAYGKGVTMIAAAGNDGNNAVSYPAAYDDYVIAVSATRFDESLAGYSNYGSSIDLAAPGGDTSVDQNRDGYVDGILQNTFDPSTQDPRDFGYYFFQGTSMAAPHVAGVAALIISQGVTDPAQVRHVLESTAQDRGPAGVDNYYGYGIVDAAAALAAIGSTNSAPVATDDAIESNEDSPVAINVLANDVDAEGDTLQIHSLTSPANGEVALNADNTITYVPAQNFHGSDSFSYTIGDGRGGTDTAVVLVTVAAINDAPLAGDDSASTAGSMPVTIAVLGNDLDIDGDKLAVASFTSPANGTVTANSDGTLTYSPKAGYVGIDSFSYTISDPAGATDTAAISVSVEATTDSDADDVAAVRVVDLDGSVTTDRSRWQAAVSIAVADSSGVAAAGVTVAGRWSNGKTFSGTTDADGRVTATSVWLQKKSASISLTVESVSHADYDPSLNSDPDGDSDGTSIIVYKDGTTATAGFQLLSDQDEQTLGRPSRSLDTIAKIEAIDAGEGGKSSLTFDYESISKQFGENTQLVVRFGDDMELRAGDGWQLGAPQVVGGEIFHTLNQNGIEVRIGNGRPWTNPLDPTDVNANGRLEPLDALRVLNLINRGNGGDLSELDAGSVSSIQYYDTTGDGTVAPIDALQIVNAMSRNMSAASSLAAGEAPAVTAAASDASEAAHDEALLALVEERESTTSTPDVRWKNAFSYEPIGAKAKTDGIEMDTASAEAEGNQRASGVLGPLQMAGWQVQ